MSDQPQRTVLITGASAGLGRAIAHSFAKRGAKLALLARNPEALDAAVNECKLLGAADAIAIPTDVSDADAVERAAVLAEETLGPIDVWVNNAMISVFAPVKDTTAEEYRRVTEVLYLGFVHGTLSALRRMLPRDRGTIIQIGSALAYRSIPLQSAYCAAKHAIVGFTDSLRCELHHDGSKVQLTQVHMPAMNTTQFDWVRNKLPHNAQPVPPIFEPEVCADVVVDAGYAASPRREYWVGTPTVKAIVGQKFIPGLLDRYLGRTGYDAQQIPEEPRDPNAPDNLYAYVPGIHAAHGKFDGRSTTSSPAAFASTHRGVVAACTGAAIAAVAFAAASQKRRRGWF